MSVVTEYFVAAESDLAVTFAGWRWGTGSLAPPGLEPPLTPVLLPDLSRFARVILRGISPSELITLRTALGLAAGDENVEAMLRPLILAPPVPNRTQWVHRLPTDLVSCLAALTVEESNPVGERWAALERKRIETLDDESVRLARLAHHRVRFWQDMLSEVGALATLAVDKAEGLYLYMHL